MIEIILIKRRQFFFCVCFLPFQSSEGLFLQLNEMYEVQLNDETADLCIHPCPYGFILALKCSDSLFCNRHVPPTCERMIYVTICFVLITI